MNIAAPIFAHVLLVLAAFAAVGVQPAWASDRAVAITKAGDIVENWSTGQHLYVKGNFGVGQKQLAALEQWLDQNGQHWTIVLMENAAGEMYVAPDGRVFQGLEAVEYALGHGLSNRTPFGQLEHPLTGERDGAVFVLFYNERKFSYFSSDAQDRRSLGMSNWINKLDRPAFRAMRGGERIVDAAKDTVSSINSRLEKLITAEQADASRQARERARAVAQLRLQIESLRQEIAKAATSRDALLQTYPEATGELANPPIGDWNNRLASIDDKLSADNVRDVAQEFGSLSENVSTYLNGYAANRSLDEEMANLSATMSDQGTGPNDVAAPIYKDAQSSLDTAREARTKGDLKLGSHLAEARQKVQNAATSIESETKRVAQAAARNKAIKTTAIATSSVAGLALGGFLILLNRRRAPAKAKAIETFGKRKTSVKDEMDNVLGLFTRSNEILGSKDKVERRGYEGETDRLSDATFESVDDLLIMSNEVERVMGEAEEMLEPKSPIDKVVNAFSSSNFEQAVNHISGEPLTFHRDRGLPSVFENDLTQAADGESDPPETITMTFEKVFDAFRQRCTDANATLDQLETSLLTANDDLAALQTEIEEVTSTDRILHEAADADGFFITPNLFDVLLPSAQTDYDQADRIAATDPVYASRKHIPSGRRKLANAKQLTEATHVARRKVFPELTECREKLENKDYVIDWIETSVLELSGKANELYAAAAQRDITEQTTAFHSEVENLSTTAHRCVACAEQIDATLVPGLEKLDSAIESGRNTIAKRLKIEEAQSLNENNYVPDNRLQAAKEQIQACRASIHRGDAAAAEDAARAATLSLEEGHSIIDDSVAAVDNFDELLRKRTGRHATIRDRIPRVTTRLKEAEQKFAASALVLKAGDPTFPDPDATVTNLLQLADEESSAATDNLENAQQLFRQGRVLQAVALLDDVEKMANRAMTHFDDIENHLVAVNNQLAANNREIETALGRAETLHRELKDPRITRATIDRYERVAGEIDSIRSGLTSGVAKRDPFAEARPMLTLKERIDQLEAHLEGDKNAHAEATRAIRGAETQLVTARRLIDQASNDGIPDSTTTTKCIRELRDLESSLTVAARRLDVPHDQWQEVDADAARIHSSLGVSSGSLRGELENAQRTVESFRRASQDVLQATRWAGPFGIRIGGSPGASELERARALLNSGDYGSVVRMVRAATMAAQSAIQQAEREVARRRREEARRAEAARRRRMRSSGTNIGVGGLGGLSSGRRSRPSRSFGGGGSRRSGRSNTSGFSRSGW